MLDKYHLPLYHENPEYHASFAWCLLDGSSETRSATIVQNPETDQQSEVNPHERVDSPFSSDLIAELDNKFEQKILGAHPKGGWDISHITFRVGKSIHEIPLS